MCENEQKESPTACLRSGFSTSCPSTMHGCEMSGSMRFSQTVQHNAKPQRYLQWMSSNYIWRDIGPAWLDGSNDMRNQPRINLRACDFFQSARDCNQLGCWWPFLSQGALKIDLSTCPDLQNMCHDFDIVCEEAFVTETAALRGPLNDSRSRCDSLSTEQLHKSSFLSYPF